MPDFDRNYHPPAPVASVALVHPVSGVSSGVERGKLDTGAAFTIIPPRLVGDLGLRAQAQLWARGYDGNYSRRIVYYAGIIIEGHELRPVRGIAVERESVLVGRNVLNEFLLTLDGRRLHFEIKPAGE